MYFKELVHVTVKAGKPRICRVQQQAGDPGKSYSSSLKAICWQNFLFLQEHHSNFIN